MQTVDLSTQPYHKTDVQHAVNWTYKALKKIPSDTVRKCFIKAGFPYSQSNDELSVKSMSNLR